MREIVIILSAAVLALAACTSAQTDSLLQQERWEDVLAVYEEPRDSVQYMDIWNVNRALALTGRLADDAFKYMQNGPEGLLPEWRRGAQESEMLSDIYYAAGHIALAQRMAFEADVCTEGGHDLRMIKRLVQTNIIFGAWAVAEKYIGFLEREGGVWKEWAAAQRRFLRNDNAVDSDPEYGPLRRCIPEENFISSWRGIEEDLKDIIRTNPDHSGAIQVLGTYYLLQCDFDTFHSFIDEYYGTAALPSLPESFAEAACMMSEMDRGWWRRVGVSSAKHQEFSDFAKRIGSGLSVEKYRGTYWYYVMRANEQ